MSGTFLAGQFLTAYCLLLTAYCLLLTAHCSLLTAHCSLLTAYCLLLTAYCLLLTAHCSPLTSFFITAIMRLTSGGRARPLESLSAGTARAAGGLSGTATGEAPEPADTTPE